MASIQQALERAANFLAQRQEPDGSWAIKAEDVRHNEPLEYQKTQILTSQSIHTIIVNRNASLLPIIIKGLNWVLNNASEAPLGLEALVFELKALMCTNTLSSAKRRYELISLILQQQAKEGYWPHYPLKTFNLTNFQVASILKHFDSKPALEKLRKWLIANMAQDGLGWGSIDSGDKESEVTFTANVILALLDCGQDPSSKEIQNARKFLESKQLSDGGWPSSKLTIANKSTVYATTLVLQALMLCSENPFSNKIKTGIKFLLNTQLENGGWPLVADEKTPKHYVTYYAAMTLALHNYLLENSAKLEKLGMWAKSPQHATRWLANEFEIENYNFAKTAILSSLLNSNILGSTQDAVARRKHIINILSKVGQLGVAEILDELKKNKAYEHLNKRAHMTLIKNDLEYLKSLSLISEQENKYFVIEDLLS
jgi:prenyltransferase beta subunit